MIRQIDEVKTLQRLEQDFDVLEAPKGELATFMNRALSEAWDEGTFSEALELYNIELQHKRFVLTLADHRIQSPAQFVAEVAEDFIQHYCDNEHDDREVARIMLTFPRGGTDWTDFEGYSRYGVQIMDMFCSACEEKEMREEEHVDKKAK